MRKLIFVLLFAATPALAQQVKLESLDKLASKAKEKAEVNLDESTLKFASGFMSDKKTDEATAKQITEGLKGVNVRSYQFEQEGAFTQSDLQHVRDQVKGPQWSRIVNVQEGKEDTQIWIHHDAEGPDGMLIMAVEAKEVTVVNLVGRIDPSDLRGLGGQLGIPNINIQKKD